MKLYPILFTLLFVVNSFSSFSQNIYKRLYPEKCDSLITANVDNPNFVILDVRTDGAWIGDHLEGSINRSTGDSDFQQRLALLPKHKIFLLHCQSGGRSAGAFTEMQNLQFAEVYEMIGGMNGWKSKQLPTTNILAPKLMLVSQYEGDGNSVDTIKVTITNRANDHLVFQSLIINDEHEITHNFNKDIVVEGAEDYTFSIYHAPDYTSNDSTRIVLESNGGTLELKASVENELATNIELITKDEFSIYPNPAKNTLFLKGLSTVNSVDIEIYNLAGQLVLQKFNHSVNTGLSVVQLNDGLHIIRIKSGESTLSKKLIIKP